MLAERVKVAKGPTWVEVDLNAVRHNLRLYLDKCPGSRIIAVVKGDAYGHGIVEISKVVLDAGAWGLGVARVSEGLLLRSSGIDAPIIVLGYSSEQEIHQAVASDLALSVSNEKMLDWILATVREIGRTPRIHLEVDTGMRRLGVKFEDAAQIVHYIHNTNSVYLEGIFTHFASADDPEGFLFRRQLSMFQDLIHLIRERGELPPIVHAANSAAALYAPESHFDAVRIGIGLYGVQPLQFKTYPLRPAMALRSVVARVLDVRAGEGVSYGHTYIAKESHRAAVIPCGYADGYPRILSNRGEVIVSGVRCPVIGKVCMDNLIVRLPEGVDTRVGDAVTLIGSQGDETVDAGYLARLAGTIPYEILCGIGRRPEKIYIN